MKKNEIVTALFLAKRNITRNKWITLFTIFIISLGFISSIIVYGVLKDTSYDMQQNYIDSITGHLTLKPYQGHNKIDNINWIMKKIKSVPEVIGAARITKKGLRVYDKNNNYIDMPCYIIQPSEFSEVSDLDDLISEGSFLNDGEMGKIVIGCYYLKSCNPNEAFDLVDLNVGKSFKAVFSDNVVSKLFLQGIYDHRFLDLENTAFISEETAIDIFPDYNPNKTDEVIIKLPNRESAESVKRKFLEMNLPVEINTWEQEATKYSGVVDSFITIGNLSFLIGVIISAISIYVLLYINILNKRVQIGIIKAIGIKSKIISFSYLIQALFLGIIGSCLGVVLTFIMIQYFKFFPIETEIGSLVPSVTLLIFFVVGISIIFASIIAGYLISRKILKQNIMKAIFNG